MNDSLLNHYMLMIRFALRRTHKTRQDFSILTCLLLAPLLYAIRFKGELRTPVGYLIVAEREILRSFVYGLFKSHFAYIYVLKALVHRNSFPVIVDVGANVGDFTLSMIKNAQKIVAIEPCRENFQALYANLQINHITNVSAVRVAAHEKEEQVFLDGEIFDMHVIQEKKGEPVKGMPLDLIVKELGIKNVDILKIDVQGHERFVIIGAKDLLEGKFVKLLIVEVHRKKGVQVQQIISLMNAYKYSLVYKDEFLFSQCHMYFVPT